MPKEKIKILLVYGHDPTESKVAKEWVKKLKESLEKRGFEVKPHPIDLEETWQRKLIKAHKDGKDFFQVEKEFATEKTKEMKKALVKKVSEEYRKYHIIDLHATPKETVNLDQQKPKRIKVREERTAYEGNILFIPAHTHGYQYSSKSYSFLELPAEFKRSGPYSRWNYPSHLTESLLEKADLKATRAANLIAPRVVRKVVHLIDSIIKTKEGIYRKPRRPQYLQTRAPRGLRKSRKVYGRKMKRR
ncbi:MAG: hypothetical protein ABIE23_02530 [archaeon]